MKTEEQKKEEAYTKKYNHYLSCLCLLKESIDTLDMQTHHGVNLKGKGVHNQLDVIMLKLSHLNEACGRNGRYNYE